jgi:hypothetical protein
LLLCRVLVIIFPTNAIRPTPMKIGMPVQVPGAEAKCMNVFDTEDAETCFFI